MSADAGAERVAEEIRRRIIQQELLPGEKLGQQQLANELEVSRVPLREGLLLLANEGVVSHQHNVGFVVTKRSDDERVQLRRMQSALEIELFKEIEWPDAKTISRLRKINHALRPKRPASTTVADLVMANHEFHSVVWGLSTSKLIVQEVLRLWGIALTYSGRDFAFPDRVHESYVDHELIVDALESGDIKKVLKATTAHRRNVYRFVRSPSNRAAGRS